MRLSLFSVVLALAVSRPANGEDDPAPELGRQTYQYCIARHGPDGKGVEADGAIYVVNWHSPITCHQDDFYRHPQRDTTSGGIWRVSKTGDPAERVPELTRAADDELIAAGVANERLAERMNPDLTAVGSSVSPERIVTELLWPTRPVKDGFSLTRLTRKDGRVLLGYPQESRDEKQLLRRCFTTGETHEIPAGDLLERENLGSLMSATARHLSRGEQVDLVASLIDLQGERATAPEFEMMFDGKTLAGWHVLPAETKNDWVVRDGIIAGTGSQDRQSFLVWKEQDLTDFELELNYRLPVGGNTGVEIRARPDPTLKRPLIGYHADIGHAGIGDAILGAWDFHFAGREEYSCQRGIRLMIDESGKTTRTAIKDPFVPADVHERDWNHVRVVAKGRNFSFFINGKPASEFTDNAKLGRFDSGGIALQIHDKGMKVEFKNIRLKKLTPRPQPEDLK